MKDEKKKGKGRKKRKQGKKITRNDIDDLRRKITKGRQ